VAQAAIADLPAVWPKGPRQTISVIWLAATAPHATSRNLLNRLPTVVWSLAFTVALIRDGPNVMRHPVLRRRPVGPADSVTLRRPR
jgi:hypothetical protein